MLDSDSDSWEKLWPKILKLVVVLMLIEIPGFAFAVISNSSIANPPSSQRARP
jgi:hypothetical protein